MSISGVGAGSVSSLYRHLQSQHTQQASQAQQVSAAVSDPDHDGDVDGPGPDVDGKGGNLDIRV